MGEDDVLIGLLSAHALQEGGALALPILLACCTSTSQTVRLILAVAAQLCLKIHQMDVETASLNAELDETEYIWPPDGVPANREGM